MHLSKLEINPANRLARRDLADPYELHRTLMRAFPSAEAGGPGRILFRSEGDSDHPLVIVQSDIEADWSRLPLAEGYLVASPLQKPFDPKFAAGQVLRFRIEANPTLKREGKRVFLTDESQQVDWLKRKSVAGGFDVIQLTSVRSRRVLGSAYRGDNAVVLGSALFDGILRIHDPAVFRSTLQSGIGSAKGFGFGLLSLAPA